MFGLETVIGLAGVLGGGGGGGGGGKAPSSNKQSQDGNTLSSGNTGSFSVGGGAPAWLWPVLLVVVGLVGLLVWKPWK